MKLLPIFEEVTALFAKKKKRTRKQQPHVQEQKYSLVPKWRRRPAGKKGQMK